MSKLNVSNITRGVYSVYNWAAYYSRGLTPYPVGSFIINIARECEMRCVMCNIWRNRGRDYEGNALDAEALTRMIKGSRFLKKMPYVVLTGGEPFLRKDTSDILMALLGFPHIKKITIGTSAYLKNKILLDVERVLRNTPEDKKIALQVSLQGIGEVQDRIKGRKDCFKRVGETVMGLKRLQEKFRGRLIIHVYSVLQGENKDAFEGTYMFARQFGLGYSFGIVNNSFYNGNEADAYTKEQVSDEDIERLVRLYPAYGMLRTWNRKDFTQKTTGIRCFAAYSSFFLDYDGWVYPCLPTSTFERFRMGNIFEEDFDGIWKNADRVRGLTKDCEMDECLQGCDRGVVKLQYFIPDVLSRMATLGKWSLLRAKGMVER